MPQVRALYPHIGFELVSRRGYTSCINNYAGNYAAEEFFGGGVTAFVGPGCSMAVDSVGRLASYWNVPVCTAAGVGAQFEDRTIYGTLVRLALTINALRDAFLKVLRHFGWQHLVVLSDSSQSFFRQLRRALEGLFADPDARVRAVFRDFDSSRSTVNYTSLLVDGSSYARVFLLAGDGEVIRQMLLDAYDLNMHDGQFAFLTAEPYKNERYFGEFSWYKEGDPRNPVSHCATPKTTVIAQSARASLLCAGGPKDVRGPDDPVPQDSHESRVQKLRTPGGARLQEGVQHQHRRDDCERGPWCGLALLTKRYPMPAGERAYRGILRLRPAVRLGTE